MYQITVVCPVKHFTRYIEGELHMKSILCDAQLLTMHTRLAKCPTPNCDSRVRFGRASFRNDEKSRHGPCILYLRRSWVGILRMVGVVSYKMFATVVSRM